MRLSSDKIYVIYNPTIDEDLFKLAAEAVDHLWFQFKNIQLSLQRGALQDKKVLAIL